MNDAEREIHGQEKQPSSHASETANELMDIAREREQRDAAWEEYQGYGEAYQRANAERAASGRIAVERYPDATVIAQINLDPVTGETVNGHDNNPEAQSHRDTEAEWQKYLDATPPEQRLVVYEGGDGHFDNRDQAIRERADAGLAIYLADESGVERTSGEPKPHEEMQALVEQGFSQTEAALYLTLRSIGAKHTGETEPGVKVDASADIYAQLAIIGVPGFRLYNDEERARIQQQPELMNSILSGMAEQGRQFALDKLNPLLQELGLAQFEETPDGSLNLPGMTDDQLVGLTLDGPGRLGEMAKADFTLRDRHVFDTITDAVQEGKRPFVVYGGSHVVALKPALNGYLKASH